MTISITDPVAQTHIFLLIFMAALLLSIKKRSSFHFDNSLTEELKGFAMLAIVFSHIGYFLVSDDRFLWPLSVAAGVGVDLFLLLSGYGLTISAVEKPLPIMDFYLKRLLKLFIPLWIVLVCLVGADWLIFQRTYQLSYLLQSLAGIYLTSNPAYDIDSPLWYLTLIFFFYLIFPLIFRKSRPFLSGIIILTATWILLQIPLPLHGDNVFLYRIHFLAFPLGIILASKKEEIGQLFQKFSWARNWILRLGMGVFLSFAFAYFAIHSGVGESLDKTQAISLLSVFLVLAIFLLKNFQFRLLNLFGKYSYEIYLIHWPILFRYQNLYQIMPAFLATMIYLGEFVILGFFLQKLSKKLSAGQSLLPINVANQNNHQKTE